MVLSTKDIIPRDPVTDEIMWEALSDEERTNVSRREAGDGHDYSIIARFFRWLMGRK